MSEGINENGVVPDAIDTDVKPTVAEALAEVGLDISKVAPRIVERLELLNATTKTIEDGLRAIATARKLFVYYEAEEKEKAFTDKEKRIIEVGSIFSDIGKTGPREATTEQQHLITDMFAVENVKDPHMKVAAFFNTYFPDTHEEKLQTFQGMGLDASMSMREFWNLHSLWTLHIISGDGVPHDAIAGASIHHILDGVNPDNILEAGDKFKEYFGDNVSFDRPEKLIIILDKYDAFVRRAKMTPEEAIAGVRDRVSKSPNFSDDEDFKTILDDLLKVVK